MNEFRGDTVSNIDKLLEIASQNNNMINIVDILNLDIKEEEELNSILIQLKKHNVSVVDNTNYEEEYIYTKDQSLYNAYINDISKIPLLKPMMKKSLLFKLSKVIKKHMIN